MFGFSGKQLAVIGAVCFIMIWLNNRDQLPFALPKPEEVEIDPKTGLPVKK